ncbi:TPA: hypothetical protein DCX16_03305 [bacterium]|nr:hypothetical protein [bacterium]
MANLEDKIGLVRNELLAEIRRPDVTVAVELKRIDSELRLLREQRKRTDEIEDLKKRISLLETRIVA